MRRGLRHWGHLRYPSTPGASGLDTTCTGLCSTASRGFFGPFKKKEQPAATSDGTAPPEGGNKFLGFDLAAMQRELEKAAAEGKAPPKSMTKLSEKNVAALKMMLQMQEKMGGAIGKNPESGFGKALGKNEDVLKQMIKMQETVLNAGKGVPPPPGGEAATTHIPSSSSPAAGTAQQPSQQRLDLGSETEELFAELRKMREKKNEIKHELESKTMALTALEADFHQAQKSTNDMRGRLKLAETDVALLNTEVVDLKDKIRDLKPFKQKAQQLGGQVKTLKHQDTAPLVKRVAELEKQLTEKSEQLRSTNRKLDRSRRTSPLLRFSGHLSDIARASGSQAYDATLVDELYGTVQDQYQTRVNDHWEQSDAKELCIGTAVAAACSEYLAMRLPHGRLDAVCEIEGNPKTFAEMLTTFGCKVEKVNRKNGNKLRVTKGDSKGAVGPYGVLYALKTFYAQTANSGKRDWKLAKLTPFLSQSILDNKNRSSIRVDTSRSSKPGGQAVNVAETHIRLNLFVDGELLLVSDAQDSRSAQQNKEAAQERLYGTKVPAFNAKLEEEFVIANKFPSPASLGVKEELGEERAKLTAEKWDNVMKPVEFDNSSSALVEEAVVSVVRESTTA